MASSVRRLIGTTALAMLVGSFAFAGVAGAGLMIPEDGPGPCTFEILGSPSSATIDVASFPTDATVSVSAPADVDVSVFVSVLPNGVPVEYGPEPSTGSPLQFGPIQLTAPSSITAGYTSTDGSAYTATCTGPGGVAAIQVLAAGSSVINDPGTRPLAFTGSDDTMTHVLIAAAAVVLGTVLVVGTRRRNRVKA